MGIRGSLDFIRRSAEVIDGRMDIGRVHPAAAPFGLGRAINATGTIPAIGAR